MRVWVILVDGQPVGVADTPDVDKYIYGNMEVVKVEFDLKSLDAIPEHVKFKGVMKSD